MKCTPMRPAYESPTVQLQETTAEQGFAATGTLENVTEEPTDTPW